MRIVLTEDTVIVVTALRTRWFPVTSVASERTGTNGIVFTLEDGRRIRSCLVTLNTIKPDSRRARRAGVRRRLMLAKEIEDAVSTATLRQHDRRRAVVTDRISPAGSWSTSHFAVPHRDTATLHASGAPA